MLSLSPDVDELRLMTDEVLVRRGGLAEATVPTEELAAVMINPPHR